MRGRPWDPLEEKVVEILFPYFGAELIGKGIGRTRYAVNKKGQNKGLKRTARGRTNASRLARINRRNRELQE